MKSHHRSHPTLPSMEGIALFPCKRLLAVLCILGLCVLPWLSARSETLASRVHDLSNEELWELKAAVEAELEARDLSDQTAATKSASGSEVMVWVPRTGSKYHSTSSCSNMKKPLEVTLTEAKVSGYTPCKKCNPPK
ncbi:MAG: hypothetical protein PHI98_14465 [Eubacteriales bacterium]|nr:hypothetical protein [Eubacteriales bacterium]